jgi:hypothetical protein
MPKSSKCVVVVCVVVGTGDGARRGDGTQGFFAGIGGLGGGTIGLFEFV